MKRTPFTFLIVAAISFAITWFFVGDRKSPDNDATVTPPLRLSDEASKATKKQEKARIPVGQRTSEDYQTAWTDLASKRLGRRDRTRLQADIFNAWAEVDLEAAIKAALELSWDDEGIPATQVMVDRSEDIWRMIQEDHFGPLGSAMLLTTWANAMGKESPEMIFGYLNELKGIELRNSLRAMVDQMNGKTDALRIWAYLQGREDLSPEDRKLVGQITTDLSHHLSIDDLNEMIQNGTGMPAESAARALTAKLLMQGDYAKFSDLLEATPDKLKNIVAAECISEQMPANKESTLAAMDHLISQKQWDLLAQPNVSTKMATLAPQVGELELAEWASNLPAREEANEIFHRGVEPFIRKDKEAAWEWMNGLETGRWRDRAFAEYSQQMLNRFNDPDASLNALNQIQDPEFKATATSWRANWEKRNGK